MRKLKLEADELVVETFVPTDAAGDARGTVRANATAAIDGCTVYAACTREESCYVELCWEEPTMNPRERRCVTPYVECSTEGWTCDFC